MKNLKIILIVVIVFLFKSCILPVEPKEKEPDGSFTVINNSNQIIFIDYKMSVNLILPTEFPQSPNTSIENLKSFKENLDYYWFDENKKLNILVYKKSTLDNNTWQVIKDQGLYDKRYDLTLEQLKALNYEIVYTGL